MNTFVIVTSLIIVLAIGTWNAVLYEKNLRLRRQLEDARMQDAVHRTQLTERQELILEQIHAQIRNREQQKVCAQLRASYDKEVAMLAHRYPELTDIDVDVILLLGIGLENQDIIGFLDLNKRTFYKRRQLISGRLSISATELNEFATQLVGGQTV